MRRVSVRSVVLSFALALLPATALVAQAPEAPESRTFRERGSFGGALLGLEVRLTHPSEPCDGDLLDFRVTLENISQPGPGPYSASIVNPVPGGTSYEPGTAADGAVFDPATGAISWEGGLDVGESKSIAFTLRLDDGLPPGILVVDEIVGTAGSGTIRVEIPIRVCGPGGGPAIPEAPPAFAAWLSSPGLPDFEAKVLIVPPDGGLGSLGASEPDCIAESLCISGALPGRPELFVKVVGPRPNGFLWVQITRFTPSGVLLWLRQVSTGLVRLYELEPAGPAEDPAGLQDRQAFNP